LINFVVPGGTLPGAVIFTITTGATTITGAGSVQTVAPTLFTANGSGSGVAAATSSVQVFQCGASGCTATPIDVSGSAPIYLALYGTGIRNRSSLSNVMVTIHGVSVPVLYADPQPTYEGLDQVNVMLPQTLRGSGVSNVVLTVDGQTANTVTVNIQ
jgi:uncharacterized protein (TIGR03437 family)